MALRRLDGAVLAVCLGPWTCSDGKGGAYGGVAVKGTAMQSLAEPALM